MDFNYVKEISLINHHSLFFNVTLYADVDYLHNEIIQFDGFHKTLKGIYNLARFDHSIEIRIVINKMNYSRLPEISRFIYRNMPFVYHVAFMGIELEGRAKLNSNKLWIEPNEFSEPLSEAVIELERRDINVSIYNLPLCSLPQNIWAFSKQSISNWKNIFNHKCDSCSLKQKCAGFFKSTESMFNKNIKPILRRK